MTSEPCPHRTPGEIRWDMKPSSVLVNCADCGAEAIVPLEWYDAEWGDD